MYYKRIFFIFLLLVLFLGSACAGADREKQGVLEPENANEARMNRLQPPQKVMDAIGAAPGMTVAEIGAGRGRYVVQLAVRVGDKGKVYAEDISARSLEHLEKRCRRWGLKNVKTILGEVTDPKLPAGELDLIFIISAYHHFDDPVALLNRARAALKPGGRLAIAEWLPSGGTTEEFGTPEEIEAQMNAAGYQLERTETFLKSSNMYIYIFRDKKDLEESR